MIQILTPPSGNSADDFWLRYASGLFSEAALRLCFIAGERQGVPLRVRAHIALNIINE